MRTKTAILKEINPLINQAANYNLRGEPDPYIGEWLADIIDPLVCELLEVRLLQLGISVSVYEVCDMLSKLEISLSLDQEENRRYLNEINNLSKRKAIRILNEIRSSN